MRRAIEQVTNSLGEKVTVRTCIIVHLTQLVTLVILKLCTMTGAELTKCHTRFTREMILILVDGRRMGAKDTIWGRFLDCLPDDVGMKAILNIAELTST